MISLPSVWLLAIRRCKHISSSSIEHRLSAQQDELLEVLKARFDANMNRHSDFEWPEVEAKLRAEPEKLWSLHEMERTGGEPDVVRLENETGEYIFCDRRDDAVFVYHNGAESYYASGVFSGLLRV